MDMAKKATLSGAILLFFAVLIGAFGAHALTELLEKNQRLNVFETASRYHFYHGLGLLLLGVLIHFNQKLAFQRSTFLCLLLGVLFFSGSLYCLAVFNAGWLGAIAPIGGILLLCGWGLLAYSVIIVSISEDNDKISK